MRNNPLIDPNIMKLIEDEINAKFTGNADIRAKDVQLFSKLNKMTCMPVPCVLDKNNRFHIEDTKKLARNTLIIGSKHQFLYGQYEIQDNDIEFRIEDPVFATAWDKTKFIVFLNGYFLNPNLYRVAVTENFEKVYVRKAIYCMIPFHKGDRLDIFYIESKDNTFSHIPYNQDVYIRTEIAYCECPNQVKVRVPYPYDSYPRNDNMFYVFDTQTHKFLDNRKDYTIEGEEHNYILLNDHTLLKNPYKDSLTFVFPYAQEKEEKEIKSGYNRSKADMFTCYYTPGDPSSVVNEGLLKFYPKFKLYPIIKENVLLFCNGDFVYPDKYNMMGSNTILLLDTYLINLAKTSRFVMYVFGEIDTNNRTDFGLSIYNATINAGQRTITLPEIPSTTEFVVVTNDKDIAVDASNHYKLSNDTITIVHNDSIPKRKTKYTFIFYDNRVVSESVDIKIVNYTPKSRSIAELSDTTMNPSYTFSKHNFILFIDGKFIEPDKYTMIHNKLSMQDTNIDLIGKKVQGIYLHYLELVQTEEWFHREIKDGDWNKLLWFDHMRAKPVLSERKEEKKP